MKTEPEMKKIDAADLEQVSGGARGAAYNPFDPFGVGQAWMTAALTYAPPFHSYNAFMPFH